MGHLVSDDLDRRLRATAPAVDAQAYDAALLERVRALPVQPRSRRRRAAPLVALAAAAVAAIVLLAGGPGGGPATASAIEQALRWFDPPHGTVLHIRMTEVARDGTRLEREVWQSADDPARERDLVRRGDTVYETAGKGEAIYDPATDTIYESAGGQGQAVPGLKPVEGMSAADKAKSAKLAKDGKVPGPDAKGQGVPAEEPVGGPIVSKVRSLLAGGRAVVRGRVTHDGQAAWAIGLKPGLARPGWTLWIAAADGRPLGLHDPGGLDATWSVYEVQPGGDARLTLTAAHPGARLVHDLDQYSAALQRLQAAGG
jgi:hypothetical protein